MSSRSVPSDDQDRVRRYPDAAALVLEPLQPVADARIAATV